MDLSVEVAVFTQGGEPTGEISLEIVDAQSTVIDALTASVSSGVTSATLQLPPETAAGEYFINAAFTDPTDTFFDGQDSIPFTVASSPTVTRRRDLPVGDPDCPDGGRLVESGRDDGYNGGISLDGILQDGEVETQSFLCHTPQGTEENTDGVEGPTEDDPTSGSATGSSPDKDSRGCASAGPGGLLALLAGIMPFAVRALRRKA